MPNLTHRYVLIAILLPALSIQAQDSADKPALDASPASQNGTGQAETLKVTTRIVVLDIVVTDKKGNLIRRDLTRDDFTILEDKQPQTIRSFEPPTEHQMPASDSAIVNSAADLKKIGDAPVTVLVLDELNSRFEDMSFSRQMMVKYLQSQPAVLKEPTVLMVAMNNSFQQIHDYTQNRDELIEAVKKHMPEYPWRMMNSGKTGPGAVERMAQVMAALQQIGQASTGTPGRKNLIWVGNGFPSANLVGLDQTQADLIEAAMRRATARLLAARITMYIINPTASSTSVVEVDTPDDLELAHWTKMVATPSACRNRLLHELRALNRRHRLHRTQRPQQRDRRRSRQGPGLLHPLLLANQHLRRPGEVSQHPRSS